MIPGGVIVVVGIALDLESHDVLQASLIGGVAQRHPFTILRALANHAVGIVCLFELSAFGPFGDLVQNTAARHHVEILRTAIVIIILRLRTVIPELDQDGGVLDGGRRVELALEAAKVVHLRGFVQAGTPRVTLAVAHVGDIHVAPVLTATRVGEIATDGIRCRRHCQQGNQSQHQ